MYKDLDRLNYFEIEGICEDLGIVELYRFHYLAPGGNLEQDLRLIHDDANAVSMCKLHAGGPRDTIILYMESGHAPLAVKVPRGVSGGGDDSVVVEEEFDWLNEGLEGEDFDDDVFGESSSPYSVPPEPNTVLPEPNNDPPQPTTDTPQPNTNTSPTNTNTP